MGNIFLAMLQFYGNILKIANAVFLLKQFELEALGWDELCK
jgi:hypothetical protein